METFWLGSHRPNWLGEVDIPLMITFRRLSGRRTFPRARAPWWQDSNGFTELSMFGEYRTPIGQYVDETRVHAREVGRLAYVSPQDWMCEPLVRAKTGLTIEEHQRRTIDNYLALRSRAPELPWVPVLQGWAPNDYLRHVDHYAARGVDLTAAPLVGLGTICRRQATGAIEGLVWDLKRLGLRLHGFGVKVLGMRRMARWLASADSMAWSFRARKEGIAMCGSLTHKNCANCLWYALRWRIALLNGVPSEQQLELFSEVVA